MFNLWEVVLLFGNQLAGPGLAAMRRFWSPFIRGRKIRQESYLDPDYRAKSSFFDLFVHWNNNQEIVNYLTLKR